MRGGGAAGQDRQWNGLYPSQKNPQWRIIQISNRTESARGRQTVAPWKSEGMGIDRDIRLGETAQSFSDDLRAHPAADYKNIGKNTTSEADWPTSMMKWIFADGFSEHRPFWEHLSAKSKWKCGILSRSHEHESRSPEGRGALSRLSSPAAESCRRIPDHMGNRRGMHNTHLSARKPGNSGAGAKLRNGASPRRGGKRGIEWPPISPSSTNHNASQ
jgi:hypothetical protein